MLCSKLTREDGFTERSWILSFFHSMSSRLPPLKKTKGAKYRQITEHLRNLINKGELKPGFRLPTAVAMAQEWQTNHFTIQLALAPLVNEGLIERLKGRGTFIRDPQSQIACVAVYLGGNFWNVDQIFYQRVYEHLQEFYQERRSRVLLFVDDRPEQNKSIPFAPLRKAIDQREVQGVIALTLTPPQAEWLRRFQVPISLFGTLGLQENRIESFELALARLAAEGCRTVGLIYPRLGRQWDMVFRNLAKRHGMETDQCWMPGMDDHDHPVEFAGYYLFKKLWSLPSRPDGLFVYPDVACRSLVVAALELGVSIPRDLRVVFHRNAGIDYLCPWKVPYLVTDVKEVARLLAKYLEAQFRHDPMPHPVVNLKLVD